MKTKIEFSKALAASMGLLSAASAITPAIAGQVLYDGSGFIVGNQSFSDSFNISGPGTLTVTLTNMTWPEPLANLNSVVSTSHGLLGAEMNPGTQTFDVTGGPVFIQWFGTGQGPLNTGVYGLDVQYQASAGGAGSNTVPLPTSIALFFSGLALLVWQRIVRAGRRIGGSPVT